MKLLLWRLKIRIAEWLIGYDDCYMCEDPYVCCIHKLKED